ncbi:hypothetical protein [Lacticaseibacillus rhamnosus]|uniref:hypothetical protein n=1 Tax=Lacticaseibacillus rhamnosus TaxID=47715 RepID=UPI003870B352
MNRQPIKDLEELKQNVKRYVTWNNHHPKTHKKKPHTPNENPNQPPQKQKNKHTN